MWEMEDKFDYFESYLNKNSESIPYTEFAT